MQNLQNEVLVQEEHPSLMKGLVARAAIVGLPVCMAVAPLTVCAEESGGTSFDATATMTTAATSIATQATSMISSIVPIAAPIMGAVVAVSIGFRLVKKFMKP